MGGSTQRKLKSKIICERALDDVGEGTSARTRPLTYDEIMLKRKGKKELEGSVEEEHEVEAIRSEVIVSNPDFQTRGINDAAKKNLRDYQRESSPNKKLEKSYRKTERKERRDVEDSRDHRRDFSPRKVGKNPRAEHTHSKIENKERRGVDNSRDHQRESSPRKKVKKSSRIEHTHNKIENSGRHDVEKSRDHQRESSARKIEKSSKTEHTHNKSEDNERHDVENSRVHQRDSSPRRKVEKSAISEHAHSKSGDMEMRDAENLRDHQLVSSPRRKVEKSSKTEYTHSKSEDKEKRDAEDSRNHQRQSSPRRKVEKSSRTEHTHSISENKEKRDAEDSRDHQRESSPRRKVEKSSRTEHTHSKSENKEKRDAEDSRDHPGRKVEKNSKTEYTHCKGENKDKHDADDRSKHKHGNDKKNANEFINDRQEHMRSKAEVQLRGDGHDSKYGYENKHRDSVVLGRYVERNGGASERENKRRDRSRDDEVYRLRDPVKKDDSGSRWGSEISEGKVKTEPSRSRFDETRSKRRRSQSQESTGEKGRKSSSSSPKAQKVVSDHLHEHVEPSSRFERDRSRRHSDVDRSKMPSDSSSSHHRRHGVSSSGLGGYSPRKRKSEAAVKTPSPIRSPDQKSAGWNQPPSGADRNLSVAALSRTQLVSQSKPSNMIGLAAGVPFASSMAKPVAAIFSNSQSAFKQASIDSVQLTQATRPMRRLYIDNIPGSATEKDIMECFNTFLLSSGSNYIRGAHPCISCMIHKEKGQALVEFLTPEDASAALSFDGRSLSGSILKIRRPKDFIDVPVRSSGSSEKSKAREEPISEVSISNIVKDSPHKIFVGGIAEGLSSEMLMEIVSAFGTLKAYRFEFNEDHKEPRAFLEYADKSVTLKACAGLNCMKLGGKVLTVTQAVPNTELLQESLGSCPFYGIPEHVKSLLEDPTQILKLKNVFDEKALDLLPEMDLEDILEDVRLECSRFGSVVSINVVKGGKTPTSISEAKDITYDNEATQPPGKKNHHLNASPTKLSVYHDDGDGKNGESLCGIQESDAVDAVEEDKLESAPTTANSDVELGATRTTIVEDLNETDKASAQNCDRKADDDPQVALFGVPTTDDIGVGNESEGNHQEEFILESVMSSELSSSGRFGLEKSGNDERRCGENVSELGKNDGTSQEAVYLPTNFGPNSTVLTVEKSCDSMDKEFEVGCVLVEFRRMEASCMAAHCLHGRAYDDRIVTVEYVPLKAYRERFPK